MIDWSPFDDRLEGKTSSKGMNSLDFFKDNTKTKIKTKIYEKIKDPPQPSLLREGANIAETWMISICDSNNSLPKQGGLGWVSSWGGSPVGVGLQLGWVSTLHLKTLVYKWLRGSVKIFSTNKSIRKNSKQAGAGGEIIDLLTVVTLLPLSLWVPQTGGWKAVPGVWSRVKSEEWRMKNLQVASASARRVAFCVVGWKQSSPVVWTAAHRIPSPSLHCVSSW